MLIKDGWRDVIKNDFTLYFILKFRIIQIENQFSIKIKLMVTWHLKIWPLVFFFFFFNGTEIFKPNSD